MARKPRTCASCRREFTPGWLVPSKRCGTCRSGLLVTPAIRKQGAVTTFRAAPWTDRLPMFRPAVFSEPRLGPAEVFARATELAVRLNPTPDEAEQRRRGHVKRGSVYETELAAALAASEDEAGDPFAPATGGSWADVDPVEVLDP